MQAESEEAWRCFIKFNEPKRNQSALLFNTLTSYSRQEITQYLIKTNFPKKIKKKPFSYT